MQGTWTDEGIRVGGNARQQFHDARGYGAVAEDGSILLTPVEAAHLIYRDDIAGVDGEGLRAVLERATGNASLEFAVYADLRDRGYYLRPASPSAAETFVVFERGTGPIDGTVAYRVRVLDEHETISVGSLSPGVVAIVDDEGEVGYVRIESVTPAGTAEPPTVETLTASLVGARVVVWNPPPELYTVAFFGQPIGGREAIEDPLYLSLVEAAYLADIGAIELEGGTESIADMATSVNNPRFPERRVVYRQLREAGAVPKTGYKFGTDFRVYRELESIDSLGHSEELVRVLRSDDTLSPQSIAVDVRLAHGVGKRMVFARAAGTRDRSVDWLSIERLTP